MHVAVDALLKTINVALVAEVAPHGSDDGKLESRVRGHRISQYRKQNREVINGRKARVCVFLGFS
jgi:hypothetical protein